MTELDAWVERVLKDWMKEQFEFENCDECGRGAEGHEGVVFLGNPFAVCRVDKEYKEFNSE